MATGAVAAAASKLNQEHALASAAAKGQNYQVTTSTVPSAQRGDVALAPAIGIAKNAKIVHGSNGAVLEDVPHLTDWLPALKTYTNPLQANPAYKAVKQYFVEEDDMVAKDIVVKLDTPGEGSHFRRAGPRKKIYFNTEEVKACIVTCGGLCPGLNTVIREIVCGLWHQYNVRDIVGIEDGYKGFYARNTRPLNPKVVNDIHKRGGTVLGTSRGGSDTTKIVNSIIDRGFNQVYIIGGDGTQKGANAIYEELRARNAKVAVAGIPKTIDNDVAVIDKYFGFDTAVEEAQRAIDAAHTEAESAENGVGVVKLMGCYSGYIAMYATLASRDVDCCLIPEVPFYLEGEGGLYEFVEKRLRENGHMVIVVAEGAGQELVKLEATTSSSDASGNKLLKDIGPWLCGKLKKYMEFRKEVVNIKYIDPTYMIRAVKSNASDNVYCTLLAHSAIHGAMAGYTGFTVGPVNNRHAYIPIYRVTETQRHVNVSDRMWARLLSSTNQPDFLHYVEKMKKHQLFKSLCTALPPEVQDLIIMRVPPKTEHLVARRHRATALRRQFKWTTDPSSEGVTYALTMDGMELLANEETLLLFVTEMAKYIPFKAMFYKHDGKDWATDWACLFTWKDSSLEYSEERQGIALVELKCSSCCPPLSLLRWLRGREELPRAFMDRINLIWRKRNSGNVRKTPDGKQYVKP